MAGSVITTVFTRVRGACFTMGFRQTMYSENEMYREKQAFSSFEELPRRDRTNNTDRLASPGNYIMLTCNKGRLRRPTYAVTVSVLQYTLGLRLRHGKLRALGLER